MTVAFLITGLSFKIINKTSKYIDFFLLFTIVLSLTTSNLFVTKYLHTQTLGSCVLVVLRGRANIAGFLIMMPQVTVLRLMAIQCSGSQDVNFNLGLI